jgi:S1-C subfamily serine protease
MKINGARCSRVFSAIGTLALAIALLSTFTGCALKPGGQSTPRVVKNALDATVHLVMTDVEGKEPKIIGSGFFVRPGLIATNLHIMEGVLNCHVKLVGKETTYNVKDIIRSEKHNVVLLKVTDFSVEPLYLGTGDFGASRRDAHVYALGNTPKSGNGFMKYHRGDSYEIKYTTCMNVPNGRKSAGKEVHLHLQWDKLITQISRESSGGPVLNGKGQVIGVTTQRFSFESSELKIVMEDIEDPRDIAISSNTLRALLDREENSE